MKKFIVTYKNKRQEEEELSVLSDSPETIKKTYNNLGFRIISVKEELKLNL